MGYKTPKEQEPNGVSVRLSICSRHSAWEEIAHFHKPIEYLLGNCTSPYYL